MSTSTFLILIVLGLFHCFTDSFYLTSFSKKKWRCTSRVILSGNGKPVEVTFEPSGKKVAAEQGDKIDDICKKNGIVIPYNCRQGRCGSCEVRLNGKVNAKVCQGALIPAGPTKKLSIAVLNSKPK